LEFYRCTISLKLELLDNIMTTAVIYMSKHDEKAFKDFISIIKN